LVRAHA